MEEDNDLFDRLPEEIVIFHIFGKIPDAKSLCSISMVSKHFSNLVFKVQSVAVKIPAKVSRMASAPPPAAAEFELFLVALIEFLAKFTSMGSLFWEYDLPEDLILDMEKGPLFKLKSSSRPYCFMFLNASSVENLLAIQAGNQDGNPTDGDDSVTPEYIRSLATNIRDQSAVAEKWSSFVRALVPSLAESLRDVVVTDSRKQGRIEFGEDALARYRDPGGGDLEITAMRLRIWHAPALKLPASGRLMKDVTLSLLLKNKGPCGRGNDDFLIAKQAFGGGEGGDDGLFAEAAFALLKRDPVCERDLCVPT